MRYQYHYRNFISHLIKRYNMRCFECHVIFLPHNSICIIEMRIWLKDIDIYIYKRWNYIIGIIYIYIFILNILGIDEKGKRGKSIGHTQKGPFHYFPFIITNGPTSSQPYIIYTFKSTIRHVSLTQLPIRLLFWPTKLFFFNVI